MIESASPLPVILLIVGGVGVLGALAWLTALFARLTRRLSGDRDERAAGEEIEPFGAAGLGSRRRTELGARERDR